MCTDVAKEGHRFPCIVSYQTILFYVNDGTMIKQILNYSLYSIHSFYSFWSSNIRTRDTVSSDVAGGMT